MDKDTGIETNKYEPTDLPIAMGGHIKTILWAYLTNCNLCLQGTVIQIGRYGQPNPVTCDLSMLEHCIIREKKLKIC